MVRFGYCRHGTYIAGGARCYQCNSERMRKEERLWQEESATRADICAKELSQIAIESKERGLALAKLEAEVIAIRDRIQFLEKALKQACHYAHFFVYRDKITRYDSGGQGTEIGAFNYPELAQYLKEKKEQ